MHELSIATNLVELACEQALRLPGARVRALHLNVGALSGVVPDALLFAFDVAATGSPIEGARLQVHDTAATVWCEVCRVTRTLLNPSVRRCPVCAAFTPELRSGDELELVSLEVEDADANR